jgi:hypothetical protein
MPSPLTDENAYGLWLGYANIEDEEYGLDEADFKLRCETFRRAVFEVLREFKLGEGVRLLDFGHGIYLEVGEGDEAEDPFVWLKSARSRLKARDFVTLAVLSHGSRWVTEDGARFAPPAEALPGVTFQSVSYPSEALRRALYADAQSRRDEDTPGGFGPGLYVDTEAVEAMGKKLKNAPTALVANGASFYRFGD